MQSYVKITRVTFLIKSLLKRDNAIDKKILIEKSKKFCDLLQSYGPAYIKLGQILSLRYDLFHKETCLELEKLQDNARPVKFSTLKNLLKDDLGKNYSLIKSIDSKPLGVASIAEVHKFSFTDSDSKLQFGVVKIQKPGAKKVIKNDLDVITQIISIIKKLNLLNKINIDVMFEEFKASVLRELDFEIEAENTEKFKEKYSDLNILKVPLVYKEFTSTKTLGLEFLDGVSLREVITEIKKTNKNEIKVNGIKFNRTNLVDNFITIVFDQIFVKGFFHGDPHPSNIIIQKDGSIAMIDFGVVINLTNAQIKIMHNLLLSLSNRDVETFAENFMALDNKPGSKDKEFIVEKLKPAFEKFDTLSNKEYSPTRLFLDIIYESLDFDIQLPGFMIIFGKVLTIYDGMLQSIDPAKNLVDLIKPQFKNYTAKEMLKDFDVTNLESKTLKFLQSLTKMSDLIINLPDEIKGTITDFKLNNTKLSKEITVEKHSSFVSKLLFIYLNVSFVVFMLATLVHVKAEVMGFDVLVLLGLNWVVILIICLWNLIKNK